MILSDRVYLDIRYTLKIKIPLVCLMSTSNRPNFYPTFAGQCSKESIAFFKYDFLSFLVQLNSVRKLKVWLIPESNDACLVWWMKKCNLLFLYFIASFNPEIDTWFNLNDRKISIIKFMDYLPSCNIPLLFILILNPFPNNDATFRC